MNGLEQPFLKKPIRKLKNSKNQTQIAAFEHNHKRKRNSVQNPFHAVKPLAFSLKFLFRRDQNHHFNLASKIF